MLNPYALAFAGGGYLLSIIAGVGYVNAKQDLAAEIESGNTRVAEAAANAQRAAREYERRVADERVAQIQRRYELEAEAREMAERVAREALARPVRVREIVRESNEECLGVSVPDTVLDSLRSD